MDASFDQLGRAVLKRWKQDNFSLGKFPGIATAALDECSPAMQMDVPAFMRDFLLSEEQPAQSDSDFGEPEIIVFSHPRFYIQLLFWMEGTTAIHQHGFSGAFHVMRGSSIHAEYAFEKAQAVTPYLRIGNLRLRKMEILETGRTVPILSGPGQIHSLFHLDSPSMTVVVRTQHDPGTDPQFNYLPPHIAMDPLHSDPLATRRKQLMDVLEQVEDPAYPQLVMEMIADLDFESGFHLLRHCMEYLQQTDDWPGAIAAFKKKHRRLATGVAVTLEEEARRSTIKSLRSSVTDPDHRFFLALLMNANNRGDLLALVAQKFPKESPAKVVFRWAESLMETSDQGVSILDAFFPPSLDCEIDVQPELFLSAFAHFMRQVKKPPAGLRDLSSRDIEQLRAAFAKSSLGLLTQ
jgi:hypothetical protein